MKVNRFNNILARAQISLRKTSSGNAANVKGYVQNKSTSPDLRPRKQNDYSLEQRKQSSNPSNHRSFLSRNSNNNSSLQTGPTYQEIINLSYQEKTEQLKKVFTDKMLSNIDCDAIDNLYELFYIKPPKLADDRSRENKDKVRYNRTDERIKTQGDSNNQDIK